MKSGGCNGAAMPISVVVNSLTKWHEKAHQIWKK
jgi:hypothetical protein